MLIYTEEQQRIFLDVLYTFVMMDDKQTKTEKALLSYLQNDIFKNSSHHITRIREEELTQNIIKLDVDIYLVYLFNLLYNLRNDPDFDKSVISKKSFIKKIDKQLEELDESIKDKITKNKNFHKSYTILEKLWY